jgi:hypothetical protein
MAAKESPDSEEEQFHDSLPEENTDDTPAPTPNDPKLMNISIQAARGQQSNNTFTVPIFLAGKLAIALVDTGSTHCFMDLKFSTKINCTTTSNNMERVIVSGGGDLLTGAHVHDIPYTIQGHKFHNAFKILPLKGYDIVLGGDWMLTHSPVKFDYATRHITIRLHGKEKISL